MRSFNILALAVAALAPFVGAAPAPLVDAGAGAVAKTDIHARLDIVAAAAAKTDIHARGTKGVAAILVDLKVDVKVHVDALNCLTKDNATSEVITPILTDIVSVIGGAVVDLKALVGADISVILCSVDGTAEVAISVVAQLLADVLCLIIGALGFVLTVVADVKILLDVIVSVALGDCLCGLISAVLALVDGLLAELVPLVLSLVSVILSLGLDVVGQLLTIC